MKEFGGYARVAALTRVKQEQNRPLFGKAYLRIGQCRNLWAYAFQIGGILGSKHSGNLDAFGHAFLGATAEFGAVKILFRQLADGLVASFANGSMTFADYVCSDFTRRIGYTGDASRYFLEHGMDKIPCKIAVELSCIYSSRGAALGAIYPQIVQKMFACTHAPIPAEKCEPAQTDGLNIPLERSLMSYDEIEENEDEAFMAYCRGI